MGICVVIPCYKVKKSILSVIGSIGPEISRIYVVDDHCPEESGKYVQSESKDKRVQVLFHEKNLGVGGAVITGYKAALREGMRIVVKVDGDGQMQPAFIPTLIQPIQERRADYTKGNRFFKLSSLRTMPVMRLVGNSVLSFVVKLCSGYWNIMDPTNGFTAIHASALKQLDLEKIDQRYFFESDILFRLGTLRAVVLDVPMDSKYGDEVSSLRIGRVMTTFPPKYCNRFVKRFFYNYFLRDFNLGSLQFVFGILFFTFGTGFGTWKYYLSVHTGVPATSGTVMLAGLPVILGFQSLWAALQFDVSHLPRNPLQRME